MANHNRFRRKNRARRVLEQFGVYQADEIVPSQFSSNLADQLAMFKMAPSQEFEHLRPRSVKSLFVGACGSCTPNSRPTFNSDSMTSQIGIENCLRMPITTLSKNLPVINFSECYENSTYIDYAKELNEEGCDEASELIRKQDAGGGEDQQEAESWMTRLTNWLRRWILNGMFPKGILYHSGQLEVLETCSLQGHPFIFLPVNRSPMDAQVLTEVLAMTKNRLDLATFYGQTPETKSKIWRWSDRQFNFLDRQDWTFHLGWSIQQATIQKLFANDKNLIAFLENDTDDGKPDLVLDNTAVLQHAMECIEQKAVDDVLLVPVGISYDVEPEANCWPCRIIDLLRMWLGFKGRYGAVQVDFDQPFSLREFERNWRKIEDNDKFYQTLGQHVLTTSWRTTQISATEVFAFAEVNNVSLDKAVSELRSLVPGGKADRFSYHCQDANDVETYVEELTNAAKSWPFLTVKAQSPAIMAAFYPEAVVVSALISTMQCPIESYAQTSVTKMVKRSCLLKNCRLLFDLLKLEGLFRLLPCENLDDVITDAVDRLKLREILSIPETFESQHTQEQWSRRAARKFDEDFDEEGSEYDSYRLKLFIDKAEFQVDFTEESVQDMQFLYSLLEPTIQRYQEVIKAKVKAMTCDGDYLETGSDRVYSQTEIKRVLDRLESFGIYDKVVEVLAKMSLRISSFMV